MRKILLFVHGTGVRRQGYDASFKLIQDKLKQFNCAVSLEECYWGDEIGVKLPEDCKSVPRYSSTRNIGGSVEDQDLAIWDKLSEDPAFELSLLAIRGGKGAPYPINRPHPVTELASQFNALAGREEFVAAIVRLGVKDTPEALLELISKSCSFEAAKKSAIAASPEHRSALARAVVAALQNQAAAAGGPVFDRAERDKLVEKLEAALGNDVRGTAGALLGWYGRTQRGKLTDKYYERIGDILRYQARGAEWRDFLSEKIAQFPHEKVIVLAHSLGGIAAFETIFERLPNNVAHLITFGSQAPFLLEIDALARVNRHDVLPLNFPQWTNFYDLNDPLSYMTQGLFDGRVTDHEIQSGQSPGTAHSAYLFSDTFWQLVSSKINLV
jgi:hypothetical protein